MPVVNIPEKICPHCNGTMWSVTKSTSSKGNRYTCSLKNRERVAAWKEKNPEKYIEGRKKVHLDMKLYREKNKLPRKRKTFKNHLPEEKLKEISLKVKSDTILTKVCKFCNEEKQLQAFYVQIRKTGKIYSKPKCVACYAREYHDKNRELVNQQAREKWKNVSDEGRQKMNEWAAEWRKNNPEKRRLAVSKCNKKRMSDPIKHEKKKMCDRIYHGKIKDNLSDNYIAGRVIGKKGWGILFQKDIPQELIDMKRTQILLKRQIS